MQRFPSLFWTLVRLRYQLIWAQARTGRGKVALLIFLYLFLIVLGFLVGLGGLGAAVAGVKLGKAEIIARGMLSGLHIGAVTTSLFFGIGPRAAFSDPVLRRYPLTAAQRLAVRHLIGLIDPVWFLLTTSTFGLALGLVVAGVGSVASNLAAAALFSLAAYLTAVLLLSIVDRLLQTRTGAALLGTVGLAAISFSGLAIAWIMNPQNAVWLEMIDRAVLAAPSGVAAVVMTGAPDVESLINLTTLVLWNAVLVLSIFWLERAPAERPSTQRGVSDRYNFDGFYDRFAAMFGRTQAPLVGKALRYYLRSNRVRLGLATTPVFAFVGKMMSQDASGSMEFYFTLSFFSFLGFSGPSSMALNQFGSDGEGVKRYAMLPVNFAAPFRASSITALLLGAAVIGPGIALWVGTTRAAVDWRMIVMLLGSSVGGLFFFNGLSMWTSLLSPHRFDFSNVFSNRLPLGANLVVGGGLLSIFALNFVLMRMKLEDALARWWMAPIAAAVGMVLYLLSWWVIEPIAEKRRSRVIEAIAG